MKAKQAGFTLVEIAIVLVIIALLLGGILKGQELITSGKVRNMVNQGEAVTAAVFAFQDRYRALPGDYPTAQVVANIPGGVNGGNGNGQITTNAERGRAWNHLGLAGFINGSYNNGGAANNWTCNVATCPTNTFNGTLLLTTAAESNGSAVNGLELWSGQNVPITVIAEMDRKIDDGQPDSGSFQISGTHSAACRLSATQYNIAANPDALCGGVYRNF